MNSIYNDPSLVPCAFGSSGTESPGQYRNERTTPDILHSVRSNYAFALFNCSIDPNLSLRCLMVLVVNSRNISHSVHIEIRRRGMIWHYCHL